MGIKARALIAAVFLVGALGTGLYVHKKAGMQRDAGQASERESGFSVADMGSTGAGPDRLVLDDMAFTTGDPAAGEAQGDLGRDPLPDPSCAGEVTLVALPGALLDVSIKAPCHAGERITLHHGGMIVTETLDALGFFSGPLPALADPAVVIVDFAAGQDLMTFAEVRGLDTVDRVLLQWQGEAGLELHALEFGAAYGALGHVWTGMSPGQGAGEVLALGDVAQPEPMLAQVYSIPHDVVRAAAGPVEISVEAEILPSNCARTVAAELLERRAGRLVSRTVTLEMPDCSAVGDFLVLNNLVESLKIAVN